MTYLIISLIIIISIYFWMSNNGKKDMSQKDLKNGPETICYDDGTPQSITNYSNGQKHGLEQHFYDTGELRLKQEFENGKAINTFTSYYKSGKVAVQSHHHQGQIHGLEYSYYETGERKQVRNWNNGKLVDSTNYERNGNLIEGEHIVYNESGNVISKAFYSRGKRQGIQTEYFDSGAIYCITPFVDDIEHGICYHFDENNTTKEDEPLVIETETFVNGVLHGISRNYDENGELYCELHWENDEIVKENYGPFDK